jgi:cytochrome c5
MKRQLAMLIVLLVVVGIAAAQCGGPPAATEAPAATKAPAATEAPAAPAALDGKALLEDRCTTCHNLDRVTQAKKTEAEWKTTVDRMVGKGAKLNQAEQETLIKYLAETYK